MTVLIICAVLFWLLGWVVMLEGAESPIEIAITATWPVVFIVLGVLMAAELLALAAKTFIARIKATP